jgi:hypothetical protein
MDGDVSTDVFFYGTLSRCINQTKALFTSRLSRGYIYQHSCGKSDFIEDVCTLEAEGTISKGTIIAVYQTALFHIQEDPNSLSRVVTRYTTYLKCILDSL